MRKGFPFDKRAAEVLLWLGLALSYFMLPGRLALMSQILIYGLFAVSLDVAMGYAGILDLGHATFFGLGAYSAGLLATHHLGAPSLGLLVAMVCSGALGYLLSFLVVRGTDLARLMITLSVCALFADFANRLASITGGTDGMQNMDVRPVLGMFSFDLYGHTAFWYSYVVVLAVFLMVRLVLSSPFGLVLRGIGENRKRMLALGSPVESRIRAAYSLSAAIAGIAGALLAQTTQFVGIDSIGLNRSFEILIILVLGGTGRLYGGLIGAIAYMLLRSAFSDLSPQYWMFWLGCVLMGVVLLGRGGIMGLLARLFERGARA